MSSRFGTVLSFEELHHRVFIPPINIDMFTHAQMSFTIFINVGSNCAKDRTRLILCNLAKCSFFSIWENILHKIGFKWGSDCIVDRLGSSSVKQYITVASITRNRWHFVAVTSDRQRHIYKIYIDEKEQKAIVQQSGCTGHRHPIALGSGADGKHGFFLGLDVYNIIIN
jgi:hypothetical protein